MIIKDYKTPRQLCYAVKNAIDATEDNFVPRAWKRYEPDSSNWWLVPSSEWPAYKYGKLYFQSAVNSMGTIYAGLHIEKGLSKNLDSVYSTPKGLRHLMQEDWLWNRLLNKAEENSFLELFSKFPSHFQNSLKLIFEAGYVDNPADFDPYSLLRKSWDVCQFSWKPSSNSFECPKAKSPSGHLQILRNFTTPRDLQPVLSALTENGWLWIDLHIAFQLDTSQKHPEQEILDEAGLWSKGLRHFIPWLKSGA